MSESRVDAFRFKLEWLLSPWTILVSMSIGIAIGVFSKNTAAAIAPVGNIYLALLQMCILPILLSAVASSLGGLVRSKKTKGSIKHIVVVLATGLVLTSLIGVVCGLIGRPGQGLGEETMDVLGNLVHESESDIDLEMFFFIDMPDPDAGPSLVNFLQEIIPPNVMASMTNGRNLQVLFFAVTLGIASGFIPKRKSDSLLNLLEGIYLAFSKVISWAMYILPIGLCCLIAEQVSQIGVDILLAMTKFVAVFTVCCILIFVISTITIWQCSKRRLTEVLSGMKDTIIIALATRSSLATIPSALDAMHTKLGFDKTNTNLIVPLGITICRFGSIVYFAVATIFVAQLYNAHLGVQGLFIALVGSILAGMATSGATGVLTLTMMLLVFEPLGLPFEAVLVLFIAIDPIVDPLRTLIIVYPACASSALISGQEQHISTERIYFDDMNCIFTESSGIRCTVLNISPFGIACVYEGDKKFESDGSVQKGTLVYKDIAIGDYNYEVTRTDRLQDGKQKLGLKIVNGIIEMGKITSIQTRLSDRGEL